MDVDGARRRHARQLSRPRGAARHGDAVRSGNDTTADAPRTADWLHEVSGGVSRRRVSASRLPRRRDAARAVARRGRAADGDTRRALPLRQRDGDPAGALVDLTREPDFDVPAPIVEKLPRRALRVRLLPGTTTSSPSAPPAPMRRSTRPVTSRCRPRPRATWTSPIATRSKATSRTSRASTSPIAPASSCIRRRGTSACGGRISLPTPQPARAWTSSPRI